jgi:transposase
MLNTATVTERSFYPAFLKIIEEKGGSGVPEVRYESYPDIQFEFLERDWLLSVKIGETPQILKDAFLQYLRHKEESGIKYGLLAMLPESVRKTKATGADVESVIRSHAAGVGSPAQYGAGRKRLPLEDMLFAMAFKVYSTVSGRRFMSDLTDAKAKGYISNLPCYNSIFNYFENETLTPHLQMLIEESSLPLASIENDFAVDSSGLSTCRFVQWVRAKYFDSEIREKKDWIKVHLMCGVKTNVVTAVEITDQYAGDSPYFKPLVERTAQGFVMNEVSADKAYLSRGNLRAVVDAQAMPYIPFKSTSAPVGKNALWRQMYHYFSYNQERFMRSYHKRSNVETTFHMIKSKFGDALRSKSRTAQINEALCKVLCHNICCLISAMHELNLKPKFYAAA